MVFETLVFFTVQPLNPADSPRELQYKWVLSFEKIITGNFSLHHRVQNGSGAHPASYPMGTRGSFPEGKATGA